MVCVTVNTMRLARRFERRGTAIVEMAIVLPVLLIFLFGIIEAGWVIFVKHNLVSAASAGARVGVITPLDPDLDPDAAMQALNETIIERVTIALTEANLDRDGVEVDPTVTDDPPFRRVRVDVSVPYSEVSIFVGFFPIPDGVRLDATATQDR